MTNEKYERATKLKTRIEHISDILNFLDSHSRSIHDGPEALTPFRFSEANKCPYILTWGEVECIRQALESERIWLVEKFEEL